MGYHLNPGGGTAKCNSWANYVWVLEGGSERVYRRFHGHFGWSLLDVGTMFIKYNGQEISP
jgi:hypothetical protein